MMRLRCLNTAAWRVLAVVKEDDECEIFDDLRALSEDKKTSATGMGFFNLFERIPSLGPRQLGTDLFHNVDANNEIYEFVKGSHRVLCFIADGRIIVCSHLLRKTRQKIAKRDTLRAAALRNEYLAASAAGRIEIIVD